jgi:hypothetical protein
MQRRFVLTPSGDGDATWLAWGKVPRKSSGDDFAKEKNKARQRRALKMRGIIQGVSIRGFQGRRVLKLVTLP